MYLSRYIHAPLLNILVNLFFNVICNLLPFFKQVLEDELSTCIFQDRVGDLSNSGVEVLNPVVGIAGVDDAVVYSRINVNRDVILGDDVLHGKTNTCLCKSSTLIFNAIKPKVSVQGLM